MTKSRNLNNQGSRKVMPDGRISYKTMVGKNDAGKPRFLQVYQRKGETPSQLKARFDSELERYMSAKPLLGENSSMYDIVKNGSNTLVKDFFKHYLTDFKKTTVKPSTYAYYKNIMLSNIVPYIGEYKLRELRPMVLQRKYQKY